MSIRWKAAIKFGLIWGVLMTIFSFLFDLQEKPFAEVIASGIFWARSLGFTIIGIVLVGYVSSGNQKD